MVVLYKNGEEKMKKVILGLGLVVALGFVVTVICLNIKRCFIPEEAGTALREIGEAD